MKNPDFIIVGETRCGTTSLFEDLIKHPDIIPAKTCGDTFVYDGGSICLSQKEIRFFDKFWYRGMNWYRACFRAVPNTVTGEASATYLYRSLSMVRIRQFFPDVKIIILLRNPVERLYSHFNHIMGMANKWPERYPTFERFINSVHENDYYIIDKGIYHKSIKVCFELFKRSQIHIIKSEDLFIHTSEKYIATLDFLGVRSFLPENFSSLRGSHPSMPMRQEVREILKEFYRPHNHALYNLIGRDMGWEKEEL